MSKLDVLTEWVEGTGRYDGQVYVVDNGAGVTLMFTYGATVGRGTFSRRVGRTQGKFVVPAKRAGDRDLPELVLDGGLHGYWQVGESRDVLYSVTLPEGATLLGPPPAEPVAEAAPAQQPADPRNDGELVAYLNDRVAGWVRCEATDRVEGDLGGGKTVLAFWTEGEGGKRRYSAPDLEAPDDSFERELAHLLNERPKLRDRLRAAANRGHGTTVMTVAMVDGAMRDRIYLSPAADQWLWNAGGVTQELCGFRKGDHEIDLRSMIASGQAVPISHNTVSGEPTDVLGILVLQGVAFCGRDGDPFKLVVPAKPGEARTVHAVVKHTVGATVYGFTVANRSERTAMAAAASEGYNDPLVAPYRRVVGYSGSAKPTYLVIPDGRVLFIPPVS